jgi:hypothetical protein
MSEMWRKYEGQSTYMHDRLGTVVVGTVTMKIVWYGQLTA